MKKKFRQNKKKMNLQKMSEDREQVCKKKGENKIK